MIIHSPFFSPCLSQYVCGAWGCTERFFFLRLSTITIGPPDILAYMDLPYSAPTGYSATWWVLGLVEVDLLPRSEDED